MITMCRVAIVPAVGKDVQDYCFVTGVPAKPIGNRI
jgi:acetyltransferase-like isoleucine patch superfamily enzyme